jgi:septum formation protein
MRKNPTIVLASESPRRIEILNSMGFDVIKFPHRLDEDKASRELSRLSPSDFVMQISYLKAKSITEEHISDVILSADTIVYSNNKILGKPSSKEEACDFIRLLSGGMHSVLTGYCLLHGEKVLKKAVSTDIYVKNMSASEINEYVDNNDVMDAAGAYKIQGVFSLFINRINGDYYNVVGLPVGSIYDSLKELGLLCLK